MRPLIKEKLDRLDKYDPPRVEQVVKLNQAESVLTEAVGDYISHMGECGAVESVDGLVCQYPDCQYCNMVREFQKAIGHPVPPYEDERITPLEEEPRPGFIFLWLPKAKKRVEVKRILNNWTFSNEEGTRIYYSDRRDLDKIWTTTLSTAWDCSTASQGEEA